MKTYRLRDADNKDYASDIAGTLGGDRRSKLYGRLDCKSARKVIAKRGTYARYRVFFADETTAIRAGYRPCSRCMPQAYGNWKAAKTAR